MTSIIEFQAHSHVRNRSQIVIDVQSWIVQSCTIEQIMENKYLAEAMK